MRRPDPSRPATARLLAGQFQYANRAFWRSPVAAFFTLVFPTTFLVVICAVVGNEVVDARSGVRLAQFLTPVFAVFGVCMASFVSLALGVAYAREAGSLKRLATTPLPIWVHLAGRVLTAVFVSLVAVLLVTGIGIVFYDVDIVWRTVPAGLMTLVVGIATFAALGLAVVSLLPTPGATQAVANGGLILLAFISDVFVMELPEGLDSLGWLFPLKHFVNAFADGFNPYLTGSGLYWDHLAVMAAWGVAGMLVAVRAFRWEPHPARARRHPRAGRAAVEADDAAATSGRSPAQLTAAAPVGRPDRWALAIGQTRYAMVALLRDPMTVFFGVAFPLIMLVFFSAIYGSAATWGGLPLPQYLAAALSVYGVCVIAYVNLAGRICEDRERRILKRLRSTPLPPWATIVGRITAAVILGLAALALVFGTGALLFDVTIEPVAALVTVATFIVTVATAAALGILLASAVRSPQSAIALALGTLLPLSMISDIFISAPELPAAMSAISWTFPLRHMVVVTVLASSGQELGSEWWLHLAVVALWGLAAAALATRLFRWEPGVSR